MPQRQNTSHQSKSSNSPHVHQAQHVKQFNPRTRNRQTRPHHLIRARPMYHTKNRTHLPLQLHQYTRRQVLPLYTRRSINMYQGRRKRTSHPQPHHQQTIIPRCTKQNHQENHLRYLHHRQKEHHSTSHLLQSTTQNRTPYHSQIRKNHQAPSRTQ